MDLNKHTLYKKARFKYYFDRWKWVVWNAFISSSFLLSASYNEHSNYLNLVLFVLTALTAILLLIVMPKTKFENSSECEEIENKIRNTKDVNK